MHIEPQDQIDFINLKETNYILILSKISFYGN